jgi:hypothetical protein
MFDTKQRAKKTNKLLSGNIWALRIFSWTENSGG